MLADRIGCVFTKPPCVRPFTCGIRLGVNTPLLAREFDRIWWNVAISKGPIRLLRRLSRLPISNSPIRPIFCVKDCSCDCCLFVGRPCSPIPPRGRNWGTLCHQTQNSSKLISPSKFLSRCRKARFKTSESVGSPNFSNMSSSSTNSILPDPFLSARSNTAFAKVRSTEVGLSTGVIAGFGFSARSEPHFALKASDPWRFLSLEMILSTNS